jgi:hypothetical protein
VISGHEALVTVYHVTLTISFSQVDHDDIAEMMAASDHANMSGGGGQHIAPQAAVRWQQMVVLAGPPQLPIAQSPATASGAAAVAGVRSYPRQVVVVVAIIPYCLY